MKSLISRRGVFMSAAVALFAPLGAKLRAAPAVCGADAISASDSTPAGDEPGVCSAIYEYDDSGRLISVTHFDAPSSEIWSYDEFQRPITLT